MDREEEVRVKVERERWPKLYPIAEVEARWQDYWDRAEVYEAAYKYRDDKDRPPFIIDTPPPFTSGELHMGHAYWNILNDVLARYKRMRGYDVLLPQGWDCQGLPTELKVQYIWKVSKEDRERFRRKCVEWTYEMIRRMKGMMKRLGYRPDWEQFEYRTMDPSYWRASQFSLLEFHRKGLIYRAEFPVHWCPHCETALAQAELGYKEEEGYLYYVKFPMGEGHLYLEIATTRPELIPACQALAVHPKDDRYKHLVGREAEVPLFGYRIPILADEAVDPSFGTGIVMICTFGDEQDIRWQQRYSLPIRKVIDEKGLMVGVGKYDGMNIRRAREAIVEDLEEKGLLARKERFRHNILCHIDRPDCLTPMEFLVKEQWLIKIKPFLEGVVEACRGMRWIPDHMLQRLIDWVDSVEWDWVISRQRIHGTPIPFWYCGGCGETIAPKPEQLPVNPAVDKPPVDICPKCGSKDILGTEDVCDCWVDSSITPLVISRFYEDEAFASRAYPSDVRQQGYDIIRTWLFYTVLRCLTLTNEPPFKEVLVNGMILGPDGHRMSKSRGNIVSPEQGLREYGADALRQALVSLNIGYDFPFKWDVVRFGKSFLQKLWSATRFSAPFLEDYSYISTNPPRDLAIIDKWILGRLRDTWKAVTGAMDGYRFYKALEVLQNFFWHDFCDDYIEIVKQRLYGQGRRGGVEAARYTLYTVLLYAIKMFAPICPHITEEIYQRIFRDNEGAVSIHATPWPRVEDLPRDEEAERMGDVLVEVIAKIRGVKSGAGLRLSAPLRSAQISAPRETLEILKREEETIKETLKIQSITFQDKDELEITIEP